MNVRQVVGRAKVALNVGLWVSAAVRLAVSYRMLAGSWEQAVSKLVAAPSRLRA